MAGTRIKELIRENLGSIMREIKIALTPTPSPEKWVFLVGCYNSGTTLLAELLSRHPLISSLPTEGHFITDQFVKDYEIGLPRMWVGREDLFRLDENSTGPDAARVKKEWGMRLDLSRPILLEKSPPNSARTRWLQKHFENAHFIAIVRNGYAVAEGISRKGDPKHIPGGWPIDKSAQQWVRGNQILFEDAKHLNHFMTISYEDLAKAPLNTLNQIFDFLNIPHLDNFDNSESFSIHERDDAIKDMNIDSINRLSDTEIATINEIAAPMLEELGYSVIHQLKEIDRDI